eukprot:12413492-Karenia_brevis.AAC.1
MKPLACESSSSNDCFKSSLFLIIQNLQTSGGVFPKKLLLMAGNPAVSQNATSLQKSYSNGWRVD